MDFPPPAHITGKRQYSCSGSLCKGLSFLLAPAQAIMYRLLYNAQDPTGTDHASVQIYIRVVL